MRTEALFCPHYWHGKTPHFCGSARLPTSSRGEEVAGWKAESKRAESCFTEVVLRGAALHRASTDPWPGLLCVFYGHYFGQAQQFAPISICLVCPNLNLILIQPVFVIRINFHWESSLNQLLHAPCQHPSPFYITENIHSHWRVNRSTICM